MERMNVRCENKKIKNDSKISGLSNLKLPTTEMSIAVYVDGAGTGWQIWEGRARFHFGQVEFEVYNSDSSRDTEQATNYKNLECRRAV